MTPPIDPIMTIRPPAWRRIMGSRAWTQRTVPQKFVSSCAFASLIDVCSAAPATPQPAHVTRASIRPCSERMSLMHLATDWSLSTSIDIPCQVPLDVPRRLAPITVQPLCCNCSAHDCPMPADAPVTRTTFLVMDSLLPTVCGSSKRTDLSPRRSLRTPARPQGAVRRVADGGLGVRGEEVVGRRIRDRVDCLLYTSPSPRDRT